MSEPTAPIPISKDDGSLKPKPQYKPPQVILLGSLVEGMGGNPVCQTGSAVLAGICTNGLGAATICNTGSFL